MNQFKIDIYTKGVLTLIAACLTILTVKQLDLFPKAYASETNSSLTIPNANYGIVPLNEDGSINVKLTAGDVVDVQIRGINESPSLYWEAIKVKIED